MVFKNIVGKICDLEEVLRDFEREMLDTDYEYKLIVGTDGQQQGDVLVCSSVILLHRVGCGARFFYTTDVIENCINIPLRDKLVKEVYYTYDILRVLEETTFIDKIGRDNVSAHVDVGSGGASVKYVEECVGWLKGMGYITISKPDSFVATHVADRYAKLKVKRPVKKKS